MTYGTAFGFRTDSTDLVLKTSDTARTDTDVPSADPELSMSLDGYFMYDLEVVLYFSTASATPGLRVRLPGDINLTTRGFRNMTYIIDASTNSLVKADQNLWGSFSDLTATVGGSSDPHVMYLKGLFHPAGDCTYTVNWAQNTASADATTMKLGSFIKATKIDKLP